MIKSPFRPSKLLSLWIEVVFYSLIIRILFFIAGLKDFSIISLFSCFFPILTGRYWFITIYFGLYLLSPFLNIALNALRKKQFAALNAVLFVLFSVCNSLHPSIAGMNSGGGWGLAWFVVLYCAGAYCRLHRTSGKKSFCGVLIFIGIPACVVILLWIANNLNIRIAQSIILNWYSYNAVPAYLMSLGLFDFFMHMNVKNPVIPKITTKIAPLTFGVYLIHAHADISPWLWNVLNLPQYMDTAWFPLVQIGITVGIFAICITIDAFRNLLFSRVNLSKPANQLDTLSNSLLQNEQFHSETIP